VHHPGREAQGRHLHGDEPIHVAVGPRRLALGIELCAVGQEKSAGTEPRRRVLQVGVVRPGQPGEEAERALHHLERVIHVEGSATVAAILLETVPGTAGVLMPPPGYLAGVREIADRYGIVLILDEVMAGFARTGEWFAFDAFEVRPDLITFAKGVNSGYVPVGGVIVSDAIAHAFDDRVYPGV
jgi:adenosylmethionine-8-amino-7-oxononanoate aminotransferase